MSNLYAGSICGTSLDGIDVALVEFPDSSSARVVAYASSSLPDDLSDPMRAIVLDGATCNALTYGQLDQSFGVAIAEAVLALISASGRSPHDIAALGSHGINLLHAPDADIPVTLQIGDPNQIARLTGITTVADFRRRDVALGGQGAPLAPAFHAAVLSHPNEPRVVLNLGGIANITVLNPGQDVIGFDTGPANGLLDAWYVLHRQQIESGQVATRIAEPQHAVDDFDRDGAWASSGHVLQPLLDLLMADSYFGRPPPKSTGKEHFNLAWLQRHLSELPAPLGANEVQAKDVQATLAELTARTVCKSVLEHCPDTTSLLVCGGGAHNSDLMNRLAHHLPNVDVTSTQSFGVSPDHVEAAAFAWLARRTLNRQTGNLPSVTGASSGSVLGGIYYP